MRRTSGAGLDRVAINGASERHDLLWPVVAATKSRLAEKPSNLTFENRHFAWKGWPIMIALETLHHRSFAPLLGQVFILHSSRELELVLQAAKLLGHRRLEAVRDPFSLTFGGPQGLRLPQGIYRLSHPSLGELEIFIAQTADGPTGSEFEAVFN